jgi:hypothetical protein
VERFAVVSVVNDTIEGLPVRANPELRDAIRTAAAEALKKRASLDVAKTTTDLSTERETESKSVSALFEQNDLIIDATDHRTALEQTLRQAREQVVIHSTFVSEQSILRIMPMLVSGAAKGTFRGLDREQSARYQAAAVPAIIDLQNGVSNRGERDPSDRGPAKAEVAD